MTKPELVVDAHAALGEGPWWDCRASLLYWLDIRGERLHIFDPDKCADRELDLESVPGAVVGRSQGGLLMAMKDGFAFVDPITGAASPICDPEADIPGNRFNDGKCDSRGRLWAGTMDEAEKEGVGSLYSLDADLSCRRLISGVGISNGLAWSADDKTMYYIDTPTRRVDAFDFDVEEGRISRRRTVIEVPRSVGYPDGMTIDEEGMLWVALWEGWGLCRWDPRTGRLLERVDVPVAKATSCAFGGQALDRLYITTASIGLRPNRSKSQPHAGGLFVMEPGVRGLPAVPFAG